MPLESHRVELWVGEVWADHPGAAALLETLTSRALHRPLEALGGYDLSQNGSAA